jgi:hypothetical protein
MIAFTQCEVCRLVDGDERLKLCRYCTECDAWICLMDIERWTRRARAWAVRAFHSLPTGANASA